MISCHGFANMIWPKISVVTTNYNLADYLERTIKSVLDQGYPNLEYIIIDGGSTDGSVEIIKRYADRLTYWVTEPDKGMYDALNKGLQRATGDIMTYINSDDLISPSALSLVAELFVAYPQISWVTGTIAQIDEQDRLIQTGPSERWSALRYYSQDYKWIQQEGTFWRRSLWEAAGGYLKTDLQLAGDFELWLRFFAHAKLFNASTVLGQFRIRRQRKTSAIHKYEAEVASCFAALVLAPELANQVLQVRRLKWQIKRLPIIRSRTLAKLAALYDFPPEITFDPDNQCLKLTQ